MEVTTCRFKATVHTWIQEQRKFSNKEASCVARAAAEMTFN